MQSHADNPAERKIEFQASNVAASGYVVTKENIARLSPYMLGHYSLKHVTFAGDVDEAHEFVPMTVTAQNGSSLGLT